MSVSNSFSSSLGVDDTSWFVPGLLPLEMFVFFPEFPYVFELIALTYFVLTQPI